MSTASTANEGTVAGTTPVFVDDSGRRGARVRFVGRAVLVALALYGVLVAIGLTGSLSFPVVQLGEVGRLPARAEQSALGGGSHQTALPAALASPRPGTSGPGGTVVSPTPRGSSSGAHAFPVASTGTMPTAASTVLANHGKSPKSVTTVPGTPPPVTTTTAPHSPNRKGHGPPTSVPGKGKGP